MAKLSHKCYLVLIITFSIILSGCQPPASGETAGVYYPWLYIKLMQAELPEHLPMPVEHIKPVQVQDTWGAARSAGRKHEGIDIFARRGTRVLSATDGLVTQVGTNQLGGQVIWILGPGLTHHYYAHLDSYAEHIQEGDWVEAGEVLAYVGNTGNARTTPPHLHYGIYLNGQGAINPYSYLVAKKQTE